MINKFFKIIHNKYYRFIKFIFFLRYLFGIFLTSLALFLIIPNFFNYEKKTSIIKRHLIEKYDFELTNHKKIYFESLPLPKLIITNAEINFDTKSKLMVKNLKIYPKIFSYYNYGNFQSNKIILKDNFTEIDFSNIKQSIYQLFNQKSRISFDDLDLKILEKNKSIIRIEDIKFTNYGYNKNLILGKIFDNRFKIELNDNLKKINFKLLKTGISGNINLNPNKKKNSTNGIFKSNIMNTKLKFNFDYDSKLLRIYNSYFRSKNITLKNNSLIILDPFVDVSSTFIIEELNPRVFKNINYGVFFDNKDILKKLNSKNKIIFSSKKFTNNLIDQFKLEMDLIYGRVIFSKNFKISDNNFNCKGSVNVLEDYPLLFFNCNMIANEKQKLLKKLSIKVKDKNKTLNLKVVGNLNIINKKINFENISMNNNYVYSKEDLIFFKEAFENIFLDEGLVEIFSYKKIKKFISEIS
tara:strand:- start:2883 stop:4283 length:1401 start_codon:yes stop_codon:yes gene_type:complete